MIYNKEKMKERTKFLNKCAMSQFNVKINEQKQILTETTKWQTRYINKKIQNITVKKCWIMHDA